MISERDQIVSLAFKAGEGQHRVICPMCAHTRKKSSERTLSIDVNETRVAWNCWHCSSTGAARLAESKPSNTRLKPETWFGLTSEAIACLASRGISAETAERCGVRCSYEWVPMLQAEVLCFVFPHLHKGKVVAAKYRAVSQKGFAMAGSASSYWLSDLATPDKDLVIVEGEMDALALIEAGIENVVSVPHGASLKPTVKDDGLSASFVFNNKHLYEKRVIIAVDNDSDGKVLEEELSRRIGRHVCWKVDWFDGCKDGNDALMTRGVDGVRDCLDRARPWPVAGLYDAEHYRERVEAVHSNGFGNGYSTGLDKLDEKYTVVPGQVTVITGVPSSGKSELFDMIMVNMAELYGWRFAVSSFENPPDSHLIKLIEKHMRKPFFGSERMSKDDVDEGIKWAQRHFSFIEQADGTPHTIESVLERAKIAVMRYGCRGVIVDPYNYIDKQGENETEFASNLLTKLRLFAIGHDVHVWFVAHPQKLQRLEGKVPIPGGYDISGCYSQDTEVLTREGWLPHSEVGYGHEVACFDPETGTMSYRRPSRVIAKPYKGSMHAYRGYGIDLMVTPDHRMLVKPYWKEPVGKGSGKGRPVSWPKGRWSFCESRNLPASQFLVPLSAPLVDAGVPVISEDMARLAGWFVSEGWFASAGFGLAQAVGPKEAEIRNLLTRLGLTFSEATDPPSGKGVQHVTRFYVGARHNKETVDFIRGACGKGAANKRIPEAVRRGTPFVKQAFLDAYLLGDGSRRKKGWAATTISKVLRDHLQQLCLELGYHCSWSKRKWRPQEHHAVSWQINIGRPGRREVSLHTARQRADHAYDGMVYCLTVPGGAYVTRRNGAAIICGNSAHFFNKADMGVTVHRADDGPGVMVRVWKARFKWAGEKGDVWLTYDKLTGRYVDDLDNPLEKADDLGV